MSLEEMSKYLTSVIIYKVNEGNQKQPEMTNNDLRM